MLKTHKHNKAAITETCIYKADKCVNIKDLLIKNNKQSCASILLLAKVSDSESGWFGRWGGTEAQTGGRRRRQWGRPWRTDQNWGTAESLYRRLSACTLCRHPPHPVPAATVRTSPPHTAGRMLVDGKTTQNDTVVTETITGKQKDSWLK